MPRIGLASWSRVARDPYTLLLGSAIALQLALANSGTVVHAGWAAGAVALFAGTCLLAVFGRTRGLSWVNIAGPCVILCVAAMWRAAEAGDTAGFGGLGGVAVVWLASNASLLATWLGVAGAVASMLVGPLLAGAAIGAEDWRRAALTGALAALVGPTINVLVRRASAALAMSEASFREAFEGAPIGMALTSVQDGTEERFLRVNEAFAAILGRRPEELVGRLVTEITHPEDVALRPDLSEGAKPGTLRKRFLRPSGRTVWVEASYAVVRDADGVPSHVIKQIQDIHTIKESERALLDALEQQRAATARLQELDRIRTDLVGTVSHELRTPITSIRGYLELLGEEQLTGAQHDMVDVAVRNTQRLADLVDNLLVLVRLDSVADPAPAGSAEVDIASVLSAAIDTVRPAVVERGQHLAVNLPIERATVRGDGEQLERVLVNLLSNASKYTPAGGDIDVELAVIDRQLRIVVADTGIGIPADEVPLLFTRFFRSSTARATSISGNGLGLAIVKSIVERHGGQVGVESEVGHGSRFTILLPLGSRADRTRPENAAADSVA